ncbi:ATP-dependent RNA helicase DBP10 [Russula earlei]|uniref:ATP-dependent RNA helicase DBP10 n=1 Tax=Russula earlei TaxID=71964 RepID=A0ACC0U1W1_9AGAM|nr:ATP-dependent RNA helicase DBP10 [Russula earlei]
MSKRRAHATSDLDIATSSMSGETSDVDHSFDISSALAQKGKAPGLLSQDDGTDDDMELEEMIRNSISRRNVKNGTELLKNTKGKKKLARGELGGGSFQSMGLFPWLLRSLSLQGFRTPTPIQRLSIPVLLANPPRDLVGMARTGSGKSLAFLVPLVQRLGGRHSPMFGARALILLPTRELALQILKVGKELARGWRDRHAGDKDGDNSESRNRGQGLRWGLVVGGEGMDEQFEMISSNPDVIIATPGRLLHLAVEMNLDLRSVQYVVFDEADRLFEMGFEMALTEIIHRLPASRQTLLFSATLPKSLVDFAKAGLQNPKLVRLDAESKISSDLRMAFFSVKQDEKDACLLVLLRDIIRVPLGPTGSNDQEPGDEAKGKRVFQDQFTAPHQTLVFAATKHHIEYLTALLTAAGYAVSHIYGSLDQSARKQQMDQFRRGRTNVLVVTDVAARGIDIPVLANVVNYDFPQGARVFVHRVGRTARAGRSGWAWSFVSSTELPYLVELQLFLGRPLTRDAPGDSEASYADSLVLGAFPREVVDDEVGYVRALEVEHHALPTLRNVMRKGQGLYERSRGHASPASYARAKEMSREPSRWGLVAAAAAGGTHPVLRLKSRTVGGRSVGEDERRRALLAVVDSFRPVETALEIGSRGKNGNADLMKERRKALSKATERRTIIEVSDGGGGAADNQECSRLPGDSGMADDEDIDAVFGSLPSSRPLKGKYHDSEFYIPYSQAGSSGDKGYSLRDGESFAEQARHATFDLAGDEGMAVQKRVQSKLTWNKKKKKFVRGDGAGADNIKMVRTESGVKLPASYRSGRFDEWRAKARANLPRVGEVAPDPRPRDRKRFKHTSITVAKPLDKLATNYERKARAQKQLEGVGTKTEVEPTRNGRHNNTKALTRARRYGDKSLGQVRSEIKTVEQIRKARKTMDKRKAKNARPSRKKGKR